MWFSASPATAYNPTADKTALGAMKPNIIMETFVSRPKLASFVKILRAAGGNAATLTVIRSEDTWASGAGCVGWGQVCVCVGRWCRCGGLVSHLHHGHARCILYVFSFLKLFYFFFFIPYFLPIFSSPVLFPRHCTAGG